MKPLLCAILLSAAVTGHINGQRLEAIETATSQAVEMTVPVYTTNPAVMSGFMSFSLSDFGVSGSYARSDEAYMVQCGTGELLGNVTAHSYLKLNTTTTVWGEARFTAGTRHDIKWNNAADYHLVAPYVIGDSVGGDLSTRQYSFTGGYAGTHGRWGWGAEAGYTAAIDYRNRDPRDKIIVSDLKVKAGATIAITSHHTIGLGGTFRVYNQESDIEFYNPNNDIHLYPLTGLGNYYPRFSSITDINTAYKGLGGGANIELVSGKRNGAFAMAGFNYLTMKQVLRDFNNLELTRADTYSITAIAGWLGKIGKVYGGVKIETLLSRLPGYENIFGSSVGNNYIMIGKRRNYLHDTFTAALSIPVNINCTDAVSIDIKPYVESYGSRETYRNPRRELTATLITPGGDLRALWRCSSRCMLSLIAGGAHVFATERCRNLNGLDLKSGRGEAVVSNFNMLTSDRTYVTTGATADFELDKTMAIGVAARYRHTHFSNHGNSNYATLGIALKF